MAIAHVASVLAHTGNGTYTFLHDDITTPSINTTGANLLIASASYNAGDGGGTLTDSKGNTWTARTARSSTNYATRLRYCSGTPTVGTGHTATFVYTNRRPLLGFYAFSGAHASPYASESGANSASATSIQPGSLTPPEDNCLVFTGLQNAFGPAQSIGGYTALTYAYVSSTTAGAAAYKIQTTAAAENPTCSWSDARECSTTLTVFKAAAATAPTIRRQRLPCAVMRASHF